MEERAKEIARRIMAEHRERHKKKDNELWNRVIDEVFPALVGLAIAAMAIFSNH